MQTKEILLREKKVYKKDLSSDCWMVQVWGLPYCSGFGSYENMCEYLSSKECGGQQIRKKILTKQFPINGLPDVKEEA